MIPHDWILWANERIIELGFQQVAAWQDSFWLLAGLLLVGLWFSGEKGALATRPNSYTRFDSRVRIGMTLFAFAAASILWFSLQGQLPPESPLDMMPLEVRLPPQERAQWVATYGDQESPAYFLLLAGALTALLATYRRRAAFLALLLSGGAVFLTTGLGQHWPFILLLCWLTGLLFATFFLLIQAALKNLFAPLLTLDIPPARIYPFLFLILIDLTHGFPLMAWLSQQIREAL
jgi:hypothetical protein